MADYEFKDGKCQYTPARVMEHYTGKQLVSTMLGPAIIRYPIHYSERNPMDVRRLKGDHTYHFAVELLDDTVWLARLPDLIEFARLIGMQEAADDKAKQLISVLHTKTDFLEVLALVRSEKENAE